MRAGLAAPQRRALQRERRRHRALHALHATPRPATGSWSRPIVDDPTYLTQPFITSSNFKKEPNDSKLSPRPARAYVMKTADLPSVIRLAGAGAGLRAMHGVPGLCVRGTRVRAARRAPPCRRPPAACAAMSTTASTSSRACRTARPPPAPADSCRRRSRQPWTGVRDAFDWGGARRSVRRRRAGGDAADRPARAAWARTAWSERLDAGRVGDGQAPGDGVAARRRLRQRLGQLLDLRRARTWRASTTSCVVG